MAQAHSYEVAILARKREWAQLCKQNLLFTHCSLDCHEFDKSNSHNDAQFLPLFEGKMIHQFNAEFSASNYFLDKDAFDNRLKSKEIYRLKQDLGIDSKQYSKLLESLFASHCEAVAKPQRSDKLLSRHCEQFWIL